MIWMDQVDNFQILREINISLTEIGRKENMRFKAKFMKRLTQSTNISMTSVFIQKSC